MMNGSRCYSSNGTNGGQVRFSAEDYANCPGYDLDLNELGLVQLEGRKPVWMSEYERVEFCGSALATRTAALFAGRSESPDARPSIWSLGPHHHQHHHHAKEIPG
jgi:hypothetical protein